MQDAGDDLPVVLTLRSGLILGHERRNHRPLLIREPEQVRHRYLQAKNGRLESQTDKPCNSLVRFTP